MPKPDAPFNMIWRTLDRALSMPVFNKHEVAIIQVARELSYAGTVVGEGSPSRPFRISAARLAERRGLHREKVCKAVTDLLDDEVFIGVRDAMQINQDYRLWSGKHQLSDRQVRECDDALNPFIFITMCGEVVDEAAVVTDESRPRTRRDQKRRSMPDSLRWRVFARDGFRCRYCGVQAGEPGVALHADHVVSVAHGGTNAVDNLITACQRCNGGKGARSLDATPEAASQ